MDNNKKDNEAVFWIDSEKYNAMTEDEQLNFNIVILDIITAQMKALLLNEPIPITNNEA